MKKSMLIIGLGSFGTNLAEFLIELGNDVMVVDLDEQVVSNFQAKYNPTNSWFGDCTSEVAIKNIGIKNFDMCFVTAGSNFQASLQITSNLRSCGAKFIVAKANNDFQEKLLYSSGADKVINPEKAIARDLARSYTFDNIYDYIEMSDGFAMADIKVSKSLVGQTIVTADIRKKFNVNVFAIKTREGITMLPEPDYIFQKGDHLKVVGKQGDIKKLK